MSTALQGIVLVFGSVVVAMLGFAVVQRWWPAELRKEHNDVAGFVFAVLGVIYAVLIGFLVIVVWEQFVTAQETADQEANDLAGVAFLARQIPDPLGQQIQDLSIQYAHSVIDEEWPLMANGEESAHTESLLEQQLRPLVDGMNPQNPKEQVVYDQELTRFHDLSNARRLRLLESHGELDPVLWTALLIGGIVVFAYTYLYGIANGWAHAAMIAALVITIAGMLFVIEAINRPFTGDVRVQPTALENVLNELRAP